MEKDRIAYLLERFMSDRLTQSEEKELWAACRAEGHEDLVGKALEDVIRRQVQLYPLAGFTGDSPRKQEILESILAADTKYLETAKPRFLNYSRWFAAAGIVLLVAASVLFLRKPFSMEEGAPASAQTIITDPRQPAPYVRSLTLPDGSTVILKAGSVLRYPPAFTGSSREVALDGEAFFDIRSITGESEGGIVSQPFIIRTGKVRTVVLGTSFSISAYPGDDNIVVSVTEGKVQVEDIEGEVLAVLTKDQQVTYHSDAEVSLESNVNSTRITSWARRDLEFDGVPLETIVGTLEKRYGVSIRFENPKLKQCLTVATFSGTESLHSILETLCMLRNATFENTSETEILISGGSCG